MASSGLVAREGIPFPHVVSDPNSGESSRSRGALIEKKIEFLESFSNKISNRRSRRWLNDHLLIELVPPLSADEIRGLFAPPPWGEGTTSSPFCMSNMGDWDSFRNIDMDKEASLVKSMENSATERKQHNVSDRMAALRAWQRVDHRTRDALRHSFLSNLIDSYEERIRTYVKEGGDGEVLVLQVEDPFHRLLLHGICEFYDLVSVTVDNFTGTRKEAKPSKVTHIRKKKLGSREVPHTKLAEFLRSAKNGANNCSPLVGCS
ncbi:uncharacterized protein LOC18440572 [Amborella trichopoda]|uniref:uncharacterized protein LOC18440572 n=1 Tax=Amborella trichopoda TaxID=13333 RepID=UPI0005D3DE6C|nr:uncharacterized protein LOC18440572 [Amborella trichopoda]|eukprot:XP_011625689.1 uncharacterized protein LOC18440572 [Amborella trichopoda]